MPGATFVASLLLLVRHLLLLAWHLLLLAWHLLLVAMHLLLVAMHLLLVASLLLVRHLATLATSSNARAPFVAMSFVTSVARGHY